MKQLKNWTIGFAALALTAAGAFAGDWHRAAELTTGGGAKEVSANYQNVRTVQLQCVEGGVNIQTLWVRNGGQKEEHRVARSLQRGEKYNIELGGRDVEECQGMDGFAPVPGGEFLAVGIIPFDLVSMHVVVPCPFDAHSTTRIEKIEHPVHPVCA